MWLFIQRMLQAARLNGTFYEEIEHDRSLNLQALLVILISSAAAGIGGNYRDESWEAVLGYMAAGVLGWAIWVGVIYFAGVKLLPEAQTRSNFGELFRTLGFASSPGILRLFGLVPGNTGALLYLFGTGWMLAAMVVAVRQALDYRGTGRAVLVTFIGWALNLLIYALFFWFNAYFLPLDGSSP